MPIVLTLPHWIVYVVFFVVGWYFGVIWRMFKESIFGR